MRARPHPLGQRRHHHRSPTPTRSTADELERRRRALRHRRAQRRRRQLRRPQGGRRRCASRPRSPPTPRSSPRWCRAGWPTGIDLDRRVPRHGRRASRARWPSAPARPPHPDQLLLALRGSGQALYVGLAEDCYVVASRALRRGRGAPTPTCASTARRRPTPTTRPPAAARSSCSTAPGAGTSTGIPRQAYDGTSCRSPTTTCSRAEITTRDIDRGDFPHFLLKEITEAPASRSARRCGASSSTRRRRPGGRRSAHDALPDDRRGPACATARIAPRAGHRPGHRRTSPARAWPRPSSGARPDGRLRVEALPATELSGFGLRPDMSRHAGRGHQPVGHHHRHQPHRRPRPGPRRHGDRHRQPAQQRPHRQGRRRALHVRRARRGDERRLHQGLLLPDRGRASCWRGPSPTRGRRHASTPPLVRGAARACPTALERHRRPAAPHDRRGGPAAGAVEAATGRSSATARTASPPRSCGSSSPSSATSRSPATPPRTRSTSTSRPSR